MICIGPRKNFAGSICSPNINVLILLSFYALQLKKPVGSKAEKHSCYGTRQTDRTTVYSKLINQLRRRRLSLSTVRSSLGLNPSKSPLTFAPINNPRSWRRSVRVKSTHIDCLFCKANALFVKCEQKRNSYAEILWMTENLERKRVTDLPTQPHHFKFSTDRS